MAISGVPTGANVATIAQGPMFIGYVFHMILFGVFLVQVFMWARRHLEKDKLWIKLYVILLTCLNILNSVLISIYLYDSLITHFDDPAYLVQANWLFSSDAWMTGVIASVVQLFFTWRVKVLTGSWWLTLTVAAFSLAGAAGSVAVAIEATLRYSKFSEFIKFKSVVILWLVASCVTDALITGILVWFLKTHKTGIQGSDDMVDRIIRATVQTGLITTVCAIIDLFTYLFIPGGLHLVFNFPLAKLYSIMLMSSLNARGAFGNSSFSDSSSIPKSQVRSFRMRSFSNATTAVHAPQRETGASAHLPRAGPEVFVHVESHADRKLNMDGGSTGCSTIGRENSDEIA